MLPSQQEADFQDASVYEGLHGSPPARQLQATRRRKLVGGECACSACLGPGCAHVLHTPSSSLARPPLPSAHSARVRIHNEAAPEQVLPPDTTLQLGHR